MFKVPDYLLNLLLLVMVTSAKTLTLIKLGIYINPQRCLYIKSPVHFRLIKPLSFYTVMQRFSSTACKTVAFQYAKESTQR